MSYVVKSNNRIASVVDSKRVVKFLKKYPKVKPSMMKYVGFSKSVYDSYVEWLTNREETKMGGRPERVDSPSFGSKTFYKFDWNGISGWSEVFQYLTDKNNK